MATFSSSQSSKPSRPTYIKFCDSLQNMCIILMVNIWLHLGIYFLRVIRIFFSAYKFCFICASNDRSRPYCLTCQGYPSN